MAGWILNCWPTWHSSRLASKAGRKDTNIYKNNLSRNFGFSFVLSLEEAVIRMAGAVSRLKSTMNEQVVSFCLLGVLFWMPHIYAFLICRIWPSSECSKQSNLFLLPVTDYSLQGIPRSRLVGPLVLLGGSNFHHNSSRAPPFRLTFLHTQCPRSGSMLFGKKCILCVRIPRSIDHGNDCTCCI